MSYLSTFCDQFSQIAAETFLLFRIQSLGSVSSIIADLTNPPYKKKINI